MRPENSESQMPFDPGDTLDRATVALRDMPTPEGPSAELIAQTQAALRRRQSRASGDPFIFWRPTVLRLAALVAIIIGAAFAYRVVQQKRGVAHPIVIETGHGKPDQPARLVVPQPTLPSIARVPAPDPTRMPAPEKHTLPPAPPAPLLADGILAGRIVFDGVAPPPRRLVGFNLPPECLKLHGGALYDESLVVNPKGALANVVVSVSDGLSGWLREEYPPPPPAILDQRGCVFEPHVVPVMVGQQLSIRNSDPFLHNVRVMAVNNPPANLGQPTSGESDTAPFEAPEVFQVRCDVHPWMQAWVRVVDNPFFAVTGRDGRFTIRGLPPGTYTLKAWHEQLGVREQQIVIVPGEGTSADFVFHAGRG